MILWMFNLEALDCVRLGGSFYLGFVLFFSYRLLHFCIATLGSPGRIACMSGYVFLVFFRQALCVLYFLWMCFRLYSNLCFCWIFLGRPWGVY